MAEAKRKTKTSTEVKRRYNEKVYDIISARVPKELAAAFKAKCAAEGIPQAQIIKKAIEDFLSQYRRCGAFPPFLLSRREKQWGSTGAT